MNAADTNAANAELANQAAVYPTIWPGTAFCSISNTAVAFVCNVDDKNANIPTDVVATGSMDILVACGMFTAGTSRYPWPEALDYGYMNYQSGLDFWHNAVEAPAHSCPGTGKSWRMFGAPLKDGPDGFIPNGAAFYWNVYTGGPTPWALLIRNVRRTFCWSLETRVLAARLRTGSVTTTIRAWKLL